MFVYGAGMFSGVTVALYPLSVIKTKQMTLPGISGGFQGVKQTASTIMRAEGVPGFYRGFTTVIFGTIPARAVYLTTLEWTKEQVASGAAGLGLAEPTLAGAANFAGGALASLATQSVTVPIDVISQKQMVHGDETVVARQQHVRAPHASHGSSPGPQGSHGSQGQGQQPSTALRASAAEAAAASEAASSGSAPSSSQSSASSSSRPAAAAAAATSSPAGQQHGSPASAHTSTPHAPNPGLEPSSSGRGAAAHTPTTATHPTSTSTSRVVRIGPLAMARLIVREEGLGGLYRGFGASVATFVPSSAVWWGAYGTYQKLIWMLVGQPPVAAAAQGPLGGGVGAAAGLEGAVGGGGGVHSTGQVMAVQTCAGVLAGCTSSIVTTPLDLVKTRIQVSYRHDGATPSFTEVAKQILRQDGPAGFLRGAVPRMLNAALWGTCMVTVYEHLKRVCEKTD